MLKIKKNLLKGVWREYKDSGAEFKLAPIDKSLLDSNKEDYREELINCIVDWKNVIDEKENLLEFNEENRRFLVYNVEGLFEWLLDEVYKLNKEMSEVLKN